MGKTGAAEKKEFKPAAAAGAPEAPVNKGKAPVDKPEACLGKACKTKPARFGFCEEHYEQFKFGLIKKTGELVSDWEKKTEHYEAYKARQQGARKAA